MIYDQTLQEPDPVVGFSGTGLNGYIELSWSPPVDPRGNLNADIVEYTLIRSTLGEPFDTLAVLTPDVTGYTDDGGESHLINGQNYEYAIVPMDTSGLFSLYNDSITVIPVGGAIAMADTAQNFGAVDHDQISTWNLVLGNSGNGDLTISSFILSSPWYSVDETSLVIPSGQIDSVLITFNPDITPGDLLDTLEMVTDDLDNPILSLALAGTSSWPVLAIDSTDLSFGDVNVVDYKTMSVVISNEGNDTLFVDSIFVEDTLSGFSVSISESRTSGRIGAMVQENYFSSSVFINPVNPIDGSEKSDNVSKNKNKSIQKNNQKVAKQNSIKVPSVANIDRWTLLPPHLVRKKCTCNSSS